MLIAAGLLVVVRFRSIAEGISRFHGKVAETIPFLYKPIPFFRSERFWRIASPLGGLLFVGVGVLFLLRGS
jgi:hypothetical protein